MLKPERVTFSADDAEFNQFANSDQLKSFLNNSLVHYSTDFKKTEQQQITSIKNSNSLDELSSITMSSQQQQQQQQPPQQQQQQQQQEIDHEPPASVPSSLLSEYIPILNENNLHQFDALTLQQLATRSNQNVSNINEDDMKTSPSHSASLIDIQREVDRVKQMKYGRTYSSPTSSLCSRLTTNPFNGSNNTIDLSSITHAVHFNEQSNPTAHLPFSSTYITSIPESIVPASGSSSTNDNHFIPITSIESPTLEDREVFETFHTKQTSMPGIAIRQSVNSLNRNITSSETDLITSLHRSVSKQALDSQSEHGTTYSGTSDEMIFNEWDKERNLFQDYINSLRTEIRVLLQERSDYQKQMETINNNLSQHKRVNLTQLNTDQTKFDLLQKSLEEKNLVLEHLQKEYEGSKEKTTNLTRKISVLRCDAKAQTGVIDELKQKIAELTVDIQNHILVKRRLEVSMMNLESDCKMIDAERIRLNNDIRDTQLSKQDLEKLLQQANVQIAEQGSTIEMLRSDNIQVRSQLSTTQRRMLQEKQQVMDYLRQIENDLVEKEQIKQRESILRKDLEKLQKIHQQDRREIEQFNLKILQDKQKLDQLEQERLQLLKTIETMDDNKMHLESELNSYKSATKRLYTHFKIPFDSIQSIDQLLPMLEDRYRTEQISQARVHQIPLVQSTPEVTNKQDTEEIHRLREELLSMNIQLKQLDEANQAWQEYQQNQLLLLRDRLKLSDIDDLPFEDIVQQIENRFDDLNNQLGELNNIQKTNGDIDGLQKLNDELQHANIQLTIDSIRQSKDTQTEDSDEYEQIRQDQSHNISTGYLSTDVTKFEEEIRQLQENLAVVTAQCTQLDGANQAWQQFHQTQLDNFRDKLHSHLPLANTNSLDDIVQHILVHLDQVQNECDTFRQQLQTSEKLNSDLRSESIDDIQAVKQTYVDTINELSQQLTMLKQHNDQLETEKYILNQQLENQSSINAKQERKTPTPDSTLSDSKLIQKHTRATPIQEVQIHTVTPVQSATSLTHEHEHEHEQQLQQLKDDLALLTSQCSQLNEANQAWQIYHQTQLHNFTNTIRDYFTFDQASSLDQLAQQISDQIMKQREDFADQHHALEQVNNELKQELVILKDKDDNTYNSSSSEQITHPSEENRRSGDEAVQKEQAREIEELRETVVSVTAQLDETKRAWEEYQQKQMVNLQSKLRGYLVIDASKSPNEIAQQIVDQVTTEREDFSERYQAITQANEELRSESTNNLESIRESYTNTVNELNQELAAMKEAYEELDAEKQRLTNEVEKRSIDIDEYEAKRSIGKVSSSLLQQSFAQVPIHTSGVSDEREVEELVELRKNFADLTTRCAQLDEANRAWQQYQQTQLDQLRTRLHEHIPIDENRSIDEIAQQVIEHMDRQKEDFGERYGALEKAHDELRTESTTNLETIKRSYVNAVDELTKELDSIKEECEQLNTEKQLLNNQLQEQRADFDREQNKRMTESTPISSSHEVPTRTITANNEMETDEVQELKKSLEVLNSQYALLNEANLAWQEFHQIQLDHFRRKMRKYVQIPDDLSFDEIAQQIIDHMSKEREEFDEQYQALDKTKTDLQTESIQKNTELAGVNEHYQQVLHDKEILLNQIQNLSTMNNEKQDTLTSEAANLNPFQQQSEMSELRETLASLTTQLDETIRSWQQFEQKQLDLLKNLLPFSNKVSLEEIIQDIILYVNQLTQEINSLQEKERNLTANFDYITNRYEQLKDEIPQPSTHDDDKLKQDLVQLQNQCTQLDTANRAWQLFYVEKIDLVKNKLKDYIEFDDNLTFDQIIQTIVDEFEQRNQLSAKNQSGTTGDNLDSLKEQLNDSQRNEQLLHQQISTLQTECQNFEQQLKENHYSIDSLRDNLQSLSNENEQFKRQYDELQQKNDFLTNNNDNLTNRLNDLERQSSPFESRETSKQFGQKQTRRTPTQEVQIHTVTPVQSVFSTNTEDEMQQLRINLTSLTAQCSQLDEANRAWQQFHQNQLDIFRHTLQDRISFDNELTLEQIAKQVIIHLDELKTNMQLDSSATIDSMQKELANHQLNESHLSENLEQLNQKLIDAYKTCDEFRERNAEILLSKQQAEIRLEEQAQQMNHLQLLNSNTEQLFQLQQHNDSLSGENQHLQLKVNDMEQRLNQMSANSIIQRVGSPRENVGIHNIDHDRDEEIRQLRTDLAAASAHCITLDEANRAWQKYQYEQIELIKQKLQERIPSLIQMENSSLEYIAEQIIHSLDQSNIQQDNFIRQNDLLKDEIQLLKQQLERQESTDSDTRMRQTRSYDKNIREAQIHTVTPVQSATSLIHEHEHEHEHEQQLKDDLALLASQCSQLNEANQAWQIYHQTQLHNFTNTIRDYFTFDQSSSLDQLAQQIIDQTMKQREDFADQHHALEQVNNELKQELVILKDKDDNTYNSSSSEQITHPSEENRRSGDEAVQKEQAREIEELRETVVSVTAQLDETKRAWEEYQQKQMVNLQSKLRGYLVIDASKSSDEIAQQIVDQFVKEREDFIKKYAKLEETFDDIRSEATSGIQSDRPSSTHSGTELNQELLALKHRFEDLEKMHKQLLSEKEDLSSQLDDRSIVVGHHSTSELSAIDEESESHSSLALPETEQIRQMQASLDTITSEFTALTQTNQNQLDSFSNKLQRWILLSPNATFSDIAHQLDNYFEQQQQNIPQTKEAATQTTIRSEKVHIGTETNQLIYINHETQIDPVAVIDQQTQTESFEQLWSRSEDKNLFDVDDENNRLEEFIEEISPLSLTDLSQRLSKDCQQILSKQNLPSSSYSSLELNHLALLTVYLLYNQHLTDDAKQLYNETLIRALKQEYELISSEKHEYIEKYNSLVDTYREEMNSNDRSFDKLRNEYDELLEQNELERLHSKQSLNDLVEKYDTREKQFEVNLFNLHLENEKLKYDLKNLENNQRETSEIDYEQLRHDFNDLVNENELLKDYNSRMYQRKLQGDEENDSGSIKTSHDVDIQCNLSDEVPPSNTVGSSWDNDWDDEKTLRHSPSQESRSEQLPKEEEITRLKSMIAEMQLENSNLKDLNSQFHQTSLKNSTISTITHDIGTHCSLRPASAYSTSHSDIENDDDRIIQTSRSQVHFTDTEDSDWNSQMSSSALSDENNFNSVMIEPAIRRTIDEQTQTDEQPQDKLTQVNSKLKRALQTIKDRVHQAVVERPELFTETSDDTIERLDHMIVTIGNQATQIDNLHNEHEHMLNQFQQLETKSTLSEREADNNDYINKIRSLTHERNNLLERTTQLEKDIQEMQSNVEITSFEQRISTDNSAQTDPTDTRQYTEHVKDKDHEASTITDRLFGFISTSQTKDTVENETQTDDQPQDKLTQVISKLKRALQTIKDRVHQAVVERPELYAETGDDTIERLDHMIATVRNQAAHIDHLQSDYDHAQRELNELQSSLEASQYQLDNERAIRVEPLVSAAPTSDKTSLLAIDDYQKQIHQLQQKVSTNEEERSLLRERLNEVELELRKTLDNHVSTIAMYEQQIESLVHERDALVQVHEVQLAESQHEIEQLQEELGQLTLSPVNIRSDNSAHEDIKALQEVIQQQSDEIKDLTDKYVSLSYQIEAQDELDKQRKETEERLTSYQHQIESLTRERSNLLDEVQRNTSSSTSTSVEDSGKQTGSQQHDKLAKMNSKLKRALQTIKDKICRVVIERPDLFANIGEETNERLDHLINTVEHQARRIDILQTELTESDEQLRGQIYELQSLLETSHKQVNYDQSIKTDTLVSSAPDLRSSNEDERILLRERLNEVELELRNTVDNHASAIAMYEQKMQTLAQERNAVVELHALRSAENQQEIEQLQEELSQQTRSPISLRSDTFSSVNNTALQDVIQQQSEELKDLTKQYIILANQMEEQDERDRQRKEIEERLAEYEHQIEDLTRERVSLLEEAQKNTALLAETIDNERRTSDQQHEKLTKVNTKLKRALQTFKDKIHRVVTERPDIFVNVGEDTSDRLDCLIYIVEDQARQINLLQEEFDQTQEQLRDEIRVLQNTLETYHQQPTTERSVKTEQPVTEAPPSDLSSYISSSVFENDQKQIHLLRKKLSENEDERILIRERLNEVEREFRKTLDECASTLSTYEQQMRSMEKEKNALIEQHAIQSADYQREIEQLGKELAKLKHLPMNQLAARSSNQDIQPREELIESQSQEQKDLSERYIALLSQLHLSTHLQSQFERLGRETEQQLADYEAQIADLTRERTNLLKEIQKKTSASAVTTDNEKQTGDQQLEKLTKVTTKLKRALQTFKDKIHRLVTERPDLFVNVGEETSERFDHLLLTVENQAAQINHLQSDLHDSEGQLQNVIRQLQSSFDLYRHQTDNEQHTTSHEHVLPPPIMVHKIETTNIERKREIQPKQAAHTDSWKDWSLRSPPRTDKKVQYRDIDIQCSLLVDRPVSVHELSESTEHQDSSVANRLFGLLRNAAPSISDETTVNDWDDQNSSHQVANEVPIVEKTISSLLSTENSFQTTANKIQQIVSENPTLFPNSKGETLEDLGQLIMIIKNFQTEINELQSSFDAYRQKTENERPRTMKGLNSNRFAARSLSMTEEHRKEIDQLKEKLHENELAHQREIERLVEERDQAREQYLSKTLLGIGSQTNFNDDSDSLAESRLSDCQSQIDVLLRERISLMEQIKQLAHQPTKHDVEIQTHNDNEPTTPIEQRIPRRVFEQEMLAWSKESEQLKQFVKQIQVENKKLKDIIFKFERITHDYTLENGRLKQENQHLSYLSYSSMQTIDDTDNNTSSDADICYLTLKWLTYEVAERTFDNHEHSSLVMDNNDPYLKQRLIDTERQFKNIRIQNQRLKKQLETYTIQFKHVQHEMNIKNQELSTLKIELDRLRTSETQYRLEADRLKADLQCDHVKIQQLERELVDLKREQSKTDNSSTNNLRELLDLKERELNALKEKLDYTTKAHQLELQEALKSNQFSLDNVQRFEQLDQRHQEKRKELERRLGKFCKTIKPLIDNQHLFKENSIIDLDDLQQLITDTEAEERVTNSLGPIRDCLGLLETQMKDLHHNLIENHARRSTKWKYKVGFECSSCESQWEVTHDIQNLQEACQDPDLFLESSRVEPMSGCSCPLIIDFIESDVRLCLDDLLDEIIVRTTVK